jgi:hypothetical protein
MEISRENIFPARRSCVPRTRNSGIVSANIADDTIRHRGERMLHAQLEALSRHAARKPMVWSFAAQLGKRWQHFAALKNYSDSVHRCEPAVSFTFFTIPLYAMIMALASVSAVSLYILTRPSPQKSQPEAGV